MLAKLSVELRELHFCKKFLIQTVISFIVAYFNLVSALRTYPGISIGEYVVRALTDRDYSMIVFPFLSFALMSKKGGETCRYPLLIRYRTRHEFFLVRYLAKTGFALVTLLEYVGIMFLVGHSLPATAQGIYLALGNPVEIIPRQFLNVFCVACVAIIIYEIMLSIVGNGLLGVMLTSTVLLMEMLVDITASRIKSWRWTLWGHATYWMNGQERLDYRFFALYWAILLSLLLILAFALNGRKDYVFEDNSKAN